ncbi:hypothetical protein EDD29_4912 [Actinocorallia herbida]|uniref:Uncharacterized protein n=1 Tax=Actinocorallia herbida TaxID=58109 RepID=A0A3N1D1A3_9ACTN|nr:DUF6000 family protein [Actinocorallia herbida]ROO87315.1 hypothetical protein EDD29_4912 [Actinocorallia herbida]
MPVTDDASVEGEERADREELMRHVSGIGTTRGWGLRENWRGILAVQRYVVWPQWNPRYLKLLAGLWPGLGKAFFRSLKRDARWISDRSLDLLLDSGWRPRLVAAYLIAIDRRTVFRARLGELLLASEGPYAGSAYCVALARFGEDADAEILVAYLERYLPRADLDYDQSSAMGTLLYLDDRLGRRRAEAFLGEDGPWHSFQQQREQETGASELENLRTHFATESERAEALSQRQ